MTATAIASSPSRGEVAVRPPALADPLPIAFGIFAFVFTVYGVRFVGVDADTLTGPTTDALNYAILIGGIAQLLGGVLALFRGITHSAWVSSIFGIWLIGFYFLLEHPNPLGAAQDAGIISKGPDGSALPAQVTSALQGANTAAWHADSVSWYVLLLLVPVLILATHPVLDRNIPLIVAFIATIVVVLLLGLAFHDVYSSVTDVTRGKATTPDLGTAVNLLRGSAYAAFLGAAAVYFLFAKTMLTADKASHAA